MGNKINTLLENRTFIIMHLPYIFSDGAKMMNSNVHQCVSQQRVFFPPKADETANFLEQQTLFFSYPSVEMSIGNGRP